MAGREQPPEGQPGLWDHQHSGEPPAVSQINKSGHFHLFRFSWLAPGAHESIVNEPTSPPIAVMMYAINRLGFFPFFPPLPPFLLPFSSFYFFFNFSDLTTRDGGSFS